MIKSEGTLGGKARIDNERISVLDIFHAYVFGMPPDEIAEEYPTLTHARIHDALSYAYDHPDDILADAEGRTLWRILKDNDMLYVDGRLVFRGVLDQLDIPPGAHIYTWDTVPEEIDEPRASLEGLRGHLQTRRFPRWTPKQAPDDR